MLWLLRNTTRPVSCLDLQTTYEGRIWTNGATAGKISTATWFRSRLLCGSLKTEKRIAGTGQHFGIVTFETQTPPAHYGGRVLLLPQRTDPDSMTSNVVTMGNCGRRRNMSCDMGKKTEIFHKAPRRSGAEHEDMSSEALRGTHVSLFVREEGVERCGDRCCTSCVRVRRRREASSSWFEHEKPSQHIDFRRATCLWMHCVQRAVMKTE